MALGRAMVSETSAALGNSALPALHNTHLKGLAGSKYSVRGASSDTRRHKRGVKDTRSERWLWHSSKYLSQQVTDPWTKFPL